MSRNIAITVGTVLFSMVGLRAQQAPVLDAAQREAAAAIEAPKLPPPLPPGANRPPVLPAPGTVVLPPPLPGQLQALTPPVMPAPSRIPDLPSSPQVVPSTSLQKGKPVTSTSTSGQFIVHGNDLSLRSAFSSRCEEISGELGRLLKDRQPWALPIVVLLNSGEAAKKEGKAVSMAVSSLTHGGFHLQITVNLRPDLRPSELRAEIVRALLAERILRNQKEVTVQRPLLLPDWVYTGVLEALDYRKKDRPSTLFAAIFKSGKIFGIEEIIEASPVEMDALSKTIYQISCCALVLALLDQPEGGDRLSRFLGSLASDPKPERELLNRAFPSFATSPASLNKWWALQLASLSRPGVSEPLTAVDTLKALDDALTLRYQAKASEIPKPRPVLAIQPTPVPVTSAETPKISKPVASTIPKSTPKKADVTVPEKPAEVAESTVAEPTEEEPARRSFFSRLNPFTRKAKSDEEIINEAIDEAAREEASISTAEMAAPSPEEPESIPAPVAVRASRANNRQPLFNKWFGDEKPKPDTDPTTVENEPAPSAIKPAMANPAPEPQAALPIKNKPTQTEPPPATPDKDKPLPEKEEVPEEEKKPSRFNPLNWFKDKPKSKDQDIPQAVPVDEPAVPEKPKATDAAKSASLENWLPPSGTLVAVIHQEVTVPQESEAVPEKPKKKFFGLFGGKKTEEELAKVETPIKATEPPSMPATEPASAPVVAPETKEKPKKESFRLGSFFGANKKEPPAEDTEKTESPAAMEAVADKAEQVKPEPTKPISSPSKSPQKAKSSARESEPTEKNEPQVAASIPIDDYAAILKRPDRKQILQRNLVALNALQNRCAILFRPIVADYSTLVTELMDGKAKDVEGRLKRLRQRSQAALDQSHAVRDQLDLHEANSSPAMSGTFDDYLRLPETIRKELPPREDPISKYLDSLDREFSR